MEYLASISWYVWLILGLLSGVLTGRFIVRGNFEGYFGYSFIGYAALVLAGAVYIFILMLSPISGSVVADIAFPLFFNVSALYVGNLVTSWAFRD